MTETRRTPYGYTIFCDDIREEVNNKLTYIGVYQQSLFVPSIPSVISKLCINSHFLMHPDDEIRPLKLRAYLPSDTIDTPTFDIDIPLDHENLPQIDPKNEAPMLELGFTFVLSPLELKQEGLIKVRMFYGDEKIRIGALRIGVLEQKLR